MSYNKMLEVILCTCGKNLGSLVDIYDCCWEKIKKAYLAAHLPGVSVDRVQWDPKWSVESGALLDILEVRKECCRTSMLAKVKISNLR